MRNMSFMLTERQFAGRTKDVTRRLGWRFLKPGDRVCGVRKGRGLAKGQHVVRLGAIEVVNAVREPLAEIINRPGDCRREGFPDMTPRDFIGFFCEHNRCLPSTVVTRIEFKHVDDTPSPTEL